MQALLEASEWTDNNPQAAAEVFASYSPKVPVGDLKRELATYTDDLRLVEVIRPATDSQKFAEKTYANVLS